MKANKVKKIVFIGAVILLLVFLHFIKILNPVENIIIKTTKPISKIFYLAGNKINKIYKRNFNSDDFISRIELLEEENSILIAENTKLKYLENENKILRQHLNFLEDKEKKYVLANVIYKSIFNNGEENQIIIDKGKKDGLQKGLVVNSSQGVIVGKILDLDDYTAKVALITDKDCRLTATIQNQSKTLGIVEGELGLSVKMKFIPQTINIEEGDIIISSGLEKNIPRGLAIGKVKQVNNNTNDVWQSIIIEPLVDIDDLVIVSVLLP